MSALLDTSVLLASLDADEPHHEVCDGLVADGDGVIYVHALAECFSTLTGGRYGKRLAPAAATQLLERSILPFVKVQALAAPDVVAALEDCESRGVRGGAIYDFLHLVAARKAGVASLVTLNLRHFRAFARPGDPVIEGP